MKLTDLDPHFLRYETREEIRRVVEGDPETWRERGSPCKEVLGPVHYMIYVETLAEAQGIMFLCPKCIAENPDKGAHGIGVTFRDRGVLPAQGMQNKQGPVRWGVSGTSYEDLTITPSVLLLAGCEWHGFITKGLISTC